MTLKVPADRFIANTQLVGVLPNANTRYLHQ